ncbi:hypothetical protein J3E64_001924 [Sphingobium sp. OAS761]|uniref:hypothetical protein n=1 Tax=Sphingobium sp. OAS761 TaxID=2817901 RepID=UPI0020A18290|nr:hypothetical protein [Sphingobium sp. OAS761]MCP1470236.1 hypothetical protein [Sphingobium sp. OAS761]
MTQKSGTVISIPWDQPATMIDLDGKAPLIGTVRDCAVHFALYKPHAQAQARVLLTQPVHREGRPTRTWLLEPGEIAALVARMRSEAN